MAFCPFRKHFLGSTEEHVMDRPEPVSHNQRRVEDRPGRETQPTEVKRKEGVLTRFVDPYDMRAEPQPEEPGYGHGV
jgi:hypothetical protein